MTGHEVAAVMATLAKAFWNGRPMPAESAVEYANHLRPLDVHDVSEAVDWIIDTNTTGFFPAIGAIVEKARDFEDARFEQLRSREYALPRSTEAKVFLPGAPWFVKLQIARQKAKLPAGFPLDELRDGHEQDLFDECSRVDVAATLVEITRWKML